MRQNKKRKVRCIMILWKGGGIYATQFYHTTLKACLEQAGAKKIRSCGLVERV